MNDEIYQASLQSLSDEELRAEWTMLKAEARDLEESCARQVKLLARRRAYIRDELGERGALARPRTKNVERTMEETE
jgi:hypothetical protein